MENVKNSLELFTELTDEELENIHGGQNMSPNLTPRKMPSPILINRLAKSNQVEANCRSYPISDLKKARVA